MNEQELRQLYDRYTPNVPFEQFVQDMQDPEYRSEFLRYTMSQMVGRSDQGVKQDPNLGPQPFKMQVPSIIQQAKPSPDQQPAPESVYDNLGLSPDRQEYVTREEDEAQKPQQPPLIGARPQETPFLSPLQIEQKYEKPPVKENIDFATSTSSPFVLNSELKRLKTSPISEDPTPAVGVAKKVIDLENLYARSVKEKTAILKYKYNNFIQDRWNEYSGSIQSEADKQKIVNLIKKEAEFFLRNEQAKLEAEVQPFYDAYAEVYNSDMNQMAMKNPTMANAYFRERSMAYSQMGTGERTLRNIIALPGLSRLQSTLADVIPGTWASAMAISENGTYEDAIANKYMRENRLNYGMARQRMAPGQKMQDPKQWQAQIANTAVKEEIDRVGQEQFNLDKKEFEKAQSARRAMLLEYAAEQEGEAAGKMASFAPSWKESTGILGISEYIQQQIGQTIGFLLPTLAVSATGAGAPAAFAAGAAMMYGVEAGSSNSESINALRDKYPKLSTQEILQQNLDEPYRDAAVRTGVINAALEQVSNLTMIGKFIPKGSVVKFIDRFVNSRAGKITIGATVDATTEWTQKKDQRYQQYLADGMSHHDALEKALEQDDSEEVIAGFFGAGGVSTIASFFNSKKKAIADAITSKISTGDPELDKQIDDEARDAQLINPPKGDLPTQPTPVEQPTVTPTQYGIQRTSRTETAPEEVTPAITPKEGDNVTLPSAVKGGMERTFEYNQGEWKQKVGGELVSVPSVQEQANAAFSPQTSTQQAKVTPSPYQIQTTARPVEATQQPTQAVTQQPDLVSEGEKELSDLLGITQEPPPVAETTGQAGAVTQPTTETVAQPTAETTTQPQTGRSKAEIEALKNSLPETQSNLRTPATQVILDYLAEVMGVAKHREDLETGKYSDWVRQVADVTVKNAKGDYTLGPYILLNLNRPRVAFDRINEYVDYIKRAKLEEAENKRQQEKREAEERAWKQSQKEREAKQQQTQPVTETTQPTPGTVYVIDNDGNVQQGKVVRENDKATTINVNGKNIFRSKDEIYTSEEEARMSLPEQAAEPTQAQQEAPSGNLNDFKRYFFNKDPKAFGGQLGTALSITQDGWKQAYKKFSKNATPEEMRMLEALMGTKAPSPAKVTQQLEDENAPVLSKQMLSDAGYTTDQIALVENNPDTYAQIDNKIVNMETMEVIPAKGSKKAAPPKRRRPVVEEKFDKKTYEDLKKAMSDPNVKIQDLLRIVAGMNVEFRDLAKQLLKIYKSNKNIRIAKFSTDAFSDQVKDSLGYYDPASNTIVVFLDRIEQVVDENAKSKNLGQERTNRNREYEVVRTLMHEIVHGVTARQLISSIPEVGSKKRQEKALKAYLKHGDNKQIKDLVKLFLESVKKYPELAKEADNKIEAYGFKNIHEFLSESFTNFKFQKLLNSLDSPVKSNETLWQSFINAIKEIINSGIDRTLSIRAGSVLESVIQIAPSLMTTDIQARGEIMGAFESKMESGMAADQQRTQSALVKIAKGLIQSGQATAGNVLQVLNSKYGADTKFNLNINEYADAILEEVTPETTQVEFDANKAVDQFSNSEYASMAESAKNRKDIIEEKVADFLRGKVTEKEQVVDFAAAWNDTLVADPTTGKVDINKKILAADINRIWNRLNAKQTRAEKVATVAQVIEAQWNARAKGKAEGVRWTVKEFRDNLIKAVQETIANSPVSKMQVQSMLSAIKRVNFFTPGSISKLKQRLEKIQTEAEYAQKIRDAKSNKRKIADLAKSKTALASNVNAAKALKSIDLDYLENDNYDEYLSITNALLNSAKGVLNNKYEAAPLAEINDYINRQLLFKEKEQLKEMGVPEEKIQAIVDKTESLDLNEEAGTEISQTEALLRERAEQLQEMLNNPETIDNMEVVDVDLNSEEFKQIKNADLNKLDATRLSFYIRVADNIINNGDNSGMGMLANIVESKKSVKELAKEIGNAKKFNVWKILNLPGYSVEQLTTIIDGVYRDRKLSVAVYDKTGIYQYFASTARRENKVNEDLKNIQKEIERLDGKYGGKSSLLKRNEQAKLTMLAELAKYAVDSSEHIEQVHSNIKISIRRILDEDAEFAKDLQTIYDKYKEAKTAEEAIELFKQNDAHVYELWKYLTSTVYSENFTKAMENNTKSVHNLTFLPFVNYLPTALRKVGKNPDVDNKAQAKASLNARPAKSTIAATRKMNDDQAYEFGNFIGRLQTSYQSSVHDVETSKYYQFVSEVLKDPEMKDIFGNLNNLNTLIEKIKSTETIQSNMGFENTALVTIMNTIGNTFATIGAASALGGVDQIFLQYPAAAASGMILLGEDANLFFAAPMGVIGDKDMREQVKKLLAEQDISVRGKLSQYDLSSKTLSVNDKNAILKAMSKFANINMRAQQAWLGPLLAADMSVAERLYIAFYLKSLKQQGVKVTSSDLGSEYQYRNEPSRKRAYAYASMMVNDALVASTTAGRAQILQTPGAEALLRRLFLPFISFPLETRMRMLNSIRKIGHNPKEGLRELSAVTAEVISYNGIRVYILPFYYAGVKAAAEAAFGIEPPEEEEPEKNKFKKWMTSVLLDVIPFNLGLGSYPSRELVNWINYKMSETEARTVNEFIKKKEETEPALEKLPDFSKYNAFWGWGTYGIGVDRFSDGFNAAANVWREDIIVLNEGEPYERILENKNGEYNSMVWWNFFNQIGPLPREVRSAGNKIYREQTKKIKEENERKWPNMRQRYIINPQ